MTRNFPAHAYSHAHVVRRLVEAVQVRRKRGGWGNQECMYICMPKRTFAATSPAVIGAPTPLNPTAFGLLGSNFSALICHFVAPNALATRANVSQRYCNAVRWFSTYSTGLICPMEVLYYRYIG